MKMISKEHEEMTKKVDSFFTVKRKVTFSVGLDKVIHVEIGGERATPYAAKVLVMGLTEYISQEESRLRDSMDDLKDKTDEVLDESDGVKKKAEKF